MRRVCTVCARAGSKGVKDKNIRPLLGKPLIAHTLLVARECGLFDAVAVSSDSEAILQVGREWGADVLVRRPDELATDHAAKEDAIKHCVAATEAEIGHTFDVVVDLDVTSPLRLCEDVAGAVRLLEESGCGNVITGAPARRSPYFNLVELDENGIASLSKTPERTIIRRQDAPACFDMNASVYVWTRDSLFRHGPLLFNPDTRLYEMPEERSIDVDSELDLVLIERLMRRRAGDSERAVCE